MEEKKLEYAKQELINKGYTCVLYNGINIFTSKKRGVSSLLNWVEEGKDFKGFVAADKVVGKATAFLYVLLNIKNVYALVMSRGAAEVFKKYGVEFSYDKLVDMIINRAGDGSCPMEAATKGIDTAEEALAAVKNKYNELNQR